MAGSEFRCAIEGVAMRYCAKLLLLVTLSSGIAVCATVPEGVVKTVVFIYRSQNGAPGQPDGTGFLVAIPNPSQPGRSWVYLVTASHVLHTDPNNLSSATYPELFVRINKKPEGSQTFHLPIVTSGSNETAFFDSDPSVDIAVIPISLPNPEQFDIAVLPEDMLVTRADLKKYNIGVGTDMFFTGMFTPFLGQTRNYPIVRFGKLAMIPEEKIPIGDRKIDAYLVETFSFGGNSGSPVFFYPSADNTPGALTMGNFIKVAGVMKGFFGDIEPIMMAQTASASVNNIPVSKENSGIAIVVPADHIRQILDSQLLASKRNGPS
jgi:hypothetical protein